MQPLDRRQLLKFTEDLVNAPEFASRKGVSATAIYKFVKKFIDPTDIYIIVGKKHWSWKKYKDHEFAPQQGKRK